MNDDDINFLFNATNIDLAAGVIDTSKKSEEIISKNKEFFKKGKEIASGFTASQSTKFMSEPWSNTCDLILALRIQIDVSKIDELNGGNRALQAIHMGLLIEVAFSGNIDAADKFMKVLPNYNGDAKHYVSEDDLSAMTMAARLYSPESIGHTETLYKKYVSGTQIVAESLITKLQPYLQKRNPNAFFAFAIASMKGCGTDLDIAKAFKLLTIAAGLGHEEAKKLGIKKAAQYPNLLSALRNGQSDVTAESVPISNSPIRIEPKASLETSPEASSPEKSEGIPTANITNPERVCLAMMKDEPYCTIIAVAEGTAAEWLASLPWDCHLLYEESFQPQNNTVDRCLRLMASSGYPAKSGELCSAPPHVAIVSLLIATYQLSSERNQLAI
jgi:hypothetical protein